MNDHASQDLNLDMILCSESSCFFFITLFRDSLSRKTSIILNVNISSELEPCLMKEGFYQPVFKVKTNPFFFYFSNIYDPRTFSPLPLLIQLSVLYPSHTAASTHMSREYLVVTTQSGECFLTTHRSTLLYNFTCPSK